MTCAPSRPHSANVYTARVSYRGGDRLDITRKSAGPDGLPFAPSWRILRPALAARRAGGPVAVAYAWPQYAADYTAEMRTSYRGHRAAWEALLRRDEVTLVCYCKDPLFCHRRLLAELLVACRATYSGERT